MIFAQYVKFIIAYTEISQSLFHVNGIILEMIKWLKPCVIWVGVPKAVRTALLEYRYCLIDKILWNNISGKNILSMCLFSSQAFKQGGRRGAKKVMIVITDGESHDSQDLQKVIEDSENDGIVRYAIAVSLLRSFSLLSFLLTLSLFLFISE